MRVLFTLIVVPMLELMFTVMVSTILIDSTVNRLWFIGIVWGIVYLWFSLPNMLICVQANGAWVLYDPIFGSPGTEGQRGLFEGYHLVFPWEKVVRSDIDITKKVEVKGVDGVYTYPNGKQARIAWFVKWSVTPIANRLPRFRNDEVVIEGIIRATIEGWLQGKIGDAKEEIGFGKKAIDTLQVDFEKIFEGDENPVESSNGISIEEITITDIDQPEQVQKAVNLAESFGEISKAVNAIVESSGNKITHREAWEIVNKQIMAQSGHAEIVTLDGGIFGNPAKKQGKGKKGGK